MENLDGLVSDWEKFKSGFLNMIPSLISAIVSAFLILVIGLWVIRLITRLFHKIMSKNDLDISVKSFLGQLVNWSLKILLFIVVISQLGVQTSSFIAMIGAAGLAVGLALQGSLANFAGGVLILVFRPFKVGDYIAASNGPEGTVASIDIFHTRLVTPQNQQIIVPNGELSNSNITNYSFFDTRRTWFDIKVSYDTDLNQAKKILLEVAKNHPSALKSPAPEVVVADIGEHAINLSVRVTAKSSDFWSMLEDLYIDCKKALDAEGIDMPYQQYDVHLVNKPSTSI